MERQRYEEAKAILRELLERQQHLEYLLQDTSSRHESRMLRSILEKMDADLEREVHDRVFFALQRINLKDQKYLFLRAIDGDTLELNPPEELKGWMRDVHIRLYGIDTPEKNEDRGPAYTALLDILCRNCAKGDLSVIWERERSRTEYAGYPRSSFERGIANIFFRLDEKVIYVNSFLAMLPHVKTRRGENDLIRGRRWLEDLRLPYHGSCPHKVPDVISNAVEMAELKPPALFGPPICLYLFSPEIIPASARSPSQVWEIIASSVREYGCPFTDFGVSDQEVITHIDSERVSPFDIPLILASEWRRSNDV